MAVSHNQPDRSEITIASGRRHHPKVALCDTGSGGMKSRHQQKRRNVVLQWDLSDTPLAQRETPGKVPTEGELLALMVALLMLEGATYDALQHRALTLHEDNRARLLDMFEYRLPELAQEFGDSESVRQRLVELTGIRVTCSPDRITS